MSQDNNSDEMKTRVSFLGLSAGEKTKIVIIYVPIIAATIFGFVVSSIIGTISIPLAGLGIVALSLD